MMQTGYLCIIYYDEIAWPGQVFRSDIIFWQVCPISRASIFAISSWVNEKSQISKFCSMRFLYTVLGITTTPQWDWVLSLPLSPMLLTQNVRWKIKWWSPLMTRTSKLPIIFSAWIKIGKNICSIMQLIWFFLHAILILTKEFVIFLFSVAVISKGALQCHYPTF